MWQDCVLEIQRREEEIIELGGLRQVL